MDRPFVCENCFNDNSLVEWIREQNTRGNCSWCGSRNIHIVDIIDIGDLFRDVAAIYKQSGNGDHIDYLLQEDWNIFSERIEEAEDDLMHRLAVDILEAGLDRHHDVDYPDYSGFFESKAPWLEDEWERTISSFLTETDTERSLEGQSENDLPNYLEVACEDMSTVYEPGHILYRARIHNERTRIEKFTITELGAPPPENTKAARANRAGEPVLYLASDAETALSEKRAWKGAAVAIARIRIKQRIMLINLLDIKLLESPFFEEHLEWKLELNGLLNRFAQELSRPIIPGEEERLYLPSQHLCDLFRRFTYDGVVYPSAMGAGYNIVLFRPENAEPFDVTYYRVQEVTYSFNKFGKYEEIYEEWPYDYLAS